MQSPSVTVRKASADDFDTVYTFINKLEQTVFTREVLIKAFHENRANPHAIYLLAEAGGIPVGYVSCNWKLPLKNKI